MKKIILKSTVIVSAFSIGGLAYACDMHGGGFGGFGLRNAPWQPYNPQVSTTDPDFAETENLTPKPVPPAKSKPSFSNAANMAARKAKARRARKKIDETSKQDPKARKAG